MIQREEIFYENALRWYGLWWEIVQDSSSREA